jgi:hypothetical protein
MKQIIEREKFAHIFARLSQVNRDRVSAVTRALVFAQDNEKEKPEDYKLDE